MSFSRQSWAAAHLQGQCVILAWSLAAWVSLIRKQLLLVTASLSWHGKALTSFSISYVSCTVLDTFHVISFFIFIFFAPDIEGFVRKKSRGKGGRGCGLGSGRWWRAPSRWEICNMVVDFVCMIPGHSPSATSHCDWIKVQFLCL